MKKIKLYFNRLFFIIVISLIFIIIGTLFIPEQTAKFIGYRGYIVLSDSMEPRISTGSLVITKVLDQTAPIEPNQIITFKANRFGEDILLTHYFKEVEVEENVTYYRTQAELANQYDNYHTVRSDIVGQYVMHVPFIGKFILFYQSKFGMLVLAEYLIIFLVNLTLKTRWKENKTLDEEIHLHKPTKKS